MADPLLISGGSRAQNPEPMAPFIDLFVTGDGEPVLSRMCQELKRQRPLGNEHSSEEAVPQ